MKRMVKLKAEMTLMTFPDLGPIQDWLLVVWGDAEVKSMLDKIAAVGPPWRRLHGYHVQT